MVDAWGWNGVFYAVAGVCALGVAVLVPAIAMEEEMMSARENISNGTVSSATSVGNNIGNRGVAVVADCESVGVSASANDRVSVA